MDDREGRLVANTALDALAVAGERVLGGELLAVQVTLVLREKDGSVCVLNAVEDNLDGHRSGPDGDLSAGDRRA
jgi:hypothetical protein